MTNAVLLNNIDHADLRVVTRHAPEFGDSVNQVLVFPTEYEEVQREYPILFRRDSSGDFQSVALLGLEKDENLFLDAEGWKARYVPAVQRRGPFMIGFQAREEGGEIRREPMIHVDLDHPRISRIEGEPVFRPQGGNSPYLEHVSTVLRVIHQGLEVSGPMFAAFGALDLIRPVAVEIQLDDAEQYVVPDVHTIDEARLAALDGAALERLHSGGFLRAAFLAAASLGNVSRLIELKNRRRRA
ncbi:SapC family protein [Sphingosinicella sp. CPCC 101087]|uniref:SapC family protein n=1 Tax=Sphingosinicella sp. CPCC 101087 TaxID=2497754 RepID=UPI00101C1659|nr:SapC family protein [Sphingosinicella sp. CPCC 101087]